MVSRLKLGLWTMLALRLAASAPAQEIAIRIDARQGGRSVSRNLAGACIEDVNHEVYGGIYSQMIFGESFQEPPRTAPVKGFLAMEGQWRVQDGEVHGDGGAGPKLVSSAQAFASYVDAIDQLAAGAKHRAVVFEFNANSHDLRRALANADAIGAIMRDGRVPVALSANCLQCDGQNDNGWNQGLLFLNPTKTWLQPPGYVTRMAARNYQPRVIDALVEGAGGTLSATATRSEDGKQIVVQVVNLDARPRPGQIRIEGFAPAKTTATVEELAGPPGARNTADAPLQIAPRRVDWRHEMKDGAASYVFPANSFTTIRFE